MPLSLTAKPAKPAKLSAMDKYLHNFDKIPGWYYKNFVNILMRLNDYQTERKVIGNVGEIGVFMGKSFISLYLLTKPSELALAVDVFEDQQYNYDQSGSFVQYNKFVAQIKQFTKDLSRLRTIKGDSSKKAAQDYLKAVDGKKFRLFSIDGCHRAAETMIDLKNAVEVLQDGGIIIIDDYFNHTWPGVSEAVAQFLSNHPAIKPFFIGFNKILLTQARYVNAYTSVLKASFTPKKEYPFFGVSVLIYE